MFNVLLRCIPVVCGVEKLHACSVELVDSFTSVIKEFYLDIALCKFFS